MSASVDDAINIYKQLTAFPSVKYGRISMEDTPGHLQVYSEWTQRDLERSEKLTFARSHVVQLDVVVPTLPHVICDELWNKESPSGRYQAIIRKVTDKKKSEEKYWVEIWSDASRLHNIDVSAADQHGKVYDNDKHFGTLEWSHAETHLLYVAERKLPKTKSYFARKVEGKDGEEDEAAKFDEFVYCESWGEQLTDKCHPVLCVLDIETGCVSLLENLPEDVSPGQAIWCPDDLGVICVGCWHVPYRLGRVYCAQRRSALFHIDLKNYTCTTLGPTDRAVSNPVFSRDETRLVFLENDAGGPHRQCSRLSMCDWSTKGIVTVVDVVGSAASVDDFPGIYADHLDETCWSEDSKRVVFSSLWRSHMELVMVHVETGQVTRLTNDLSVGSWNLLDIRRDLMLAACSSPSQPPYLVIGKLPSIGEPITIKWLRLDSEPEPLPQVLWKTVPVAVPESRVNPKFPILDYEYILMEPVSADTPPLAVCIHGGPHSSFVADFQVYMAGLCMCGYAVLMVNYRGSLGFGQDSINSLLGNIGRQDIDDIQDVVEQIATSGAVDRGKVVVIGGSHGGFLTLHAIGQFPDFYRAAVARNPVTNIASFVGCTDIPDWAFTETGLDFNPMTVPTSEIYSEMLKRSPAVNVDSIKTPLMLMIGGKDIRVPTSQGLELKKALEARNAPPRVLWYPECSHPLDEVKSEADAFINIIKWFDDHIITRP